MAENSYNIATTSPLWKKLIQEHLPCPVCKSKVMPKEGTSTSAYRKLATCSPECARLYHAMRCKRDDPNTGWPKVSARDPFRGDVFGRYTVRTTDYGRVGNGDMAASYSSVALTWE